MAVELGMANQFILDLSANTKRGLHEKVRRGEYPSRAPLGYLNDVRTKRIIVERKTAKVVVAAFELYAQGNSRLGDISAFFAKHGVRADTKNSFKRDRISRILSDIFYCGLFQYVGETYEGKHEAIEGKLQRLLTAYLDQDIEREVYLKEKADLLSRKKSLEEKIANLGRGSAAWLEPLVTRPSYRIFLHSSE